MTIKVLVKHVNVGVPDDLLIAKAGNNPTVKLKPGNEAEFYVYELQDLSVYKARRKTHGRRRSDHYNDSFRTLAQASL